MSEPLVTVCPEIPELPSLARALELMPGLWIRYFDSSPEGACVHVGWSRDDLDATRLSVVAWGHDLETALRQAISLEEDFRDQERAAAAESSRP